MLLATLLLLCPLPQTAEVTRTADLPPAVSDSANDASGSQRLPSAPVPKVKSDAEEASESGNLLASASAESVMPRAEMPAIQPVKNAFVRPRETATQRRVWYALTITSHSAAAFDAWSTRRAISRGYGTESNPLLRPFAHSGALYAATQVSPVVMDYLGKRMMVSEHRWVRRMWWLPQAAGSGVSVAAGVHNMGVVP